MAAHARTHMHARTHARTHTHTRTHNHARAHALTHARTSTHTHTHAHPCVPHPSRLSYAAQVPVRANGTGVAVSAYVRRGLRTLVVLAAWSGAAGDAPVAVALRVGWAATGSHGGLIAVLE
jgi:hypothetical protein